MNRHLNNARAALGSAYDAEDNASLLARAQAEALLAVAEELRSANMIAALESSWFDVIQGSGSCALTVAVVTEIRERVLDGIRIERNVCKWTDDTEAADQ